MKKIRKDAGVALLVELLVICLVLATLAAMSAPSLVQMGKAASSQDAKSRVQRFSAVMGAIAVCDATAGCAVPVGLSAQIMPGSVNQGSYAFTYTDLGGGQWTYIATPGTSIFAGTQSYFLDQSGIVRCGSNVGANPC